MRFSLEKIALAGQGPSESVWRLCYGVCRSAGPVEIPLDVVGARAQCRAAMYVLSNGILFLAGVFTSIRLFHVWFGNLSGKGWVL